MIKKVTIITPPEYESLILESLGRSGVIQFKEVSGHDLEWLQMGSERVTDYKALYQEIHPRYLELSELSDRARAHLWKKMNCPVAEAKAEKISQVRGKG